MIPLGDLLPYVGLAVAVACLVAALVGRWRRWAVGAAVGLFVLALFVPPPGEAAETARLHLHPFPVSLLNLILAAFATMAGSVVRLIGWSIWVAWRRLKRT